MVQYYSDEILELEVNGPIIFYIAVKQDDNKFLTEDFKETGEVMTMLRINSQTEVKNNKLRAVNSYGMKIFKKRFKN